MADDKVRDALNKLKDLAHLKNQLEDIQKRVEEEVQAGIPQGGSLLASPFLKGFLAGYVVAKLRSSAVMGVLIGTCTGIYAAQNFDVPNIEKTIKDYFNSIKKGPN
ncbi:SLC35A4 upstream open reading frame protein-like isoform X1 [Polyodon spathula]|uniref:SLC35A4 upstream open reading frame protein-like isoform X1 n=1 Tax=Polyodon spathula TaxID=7913 RepID=UPI001B7EF9AF|nr:SLC35A4 upstream open reading frame protein-like isoform X1 [Polyodon spathula]